MNLNTYILFLFSGWIIAALPGASTFFALSQSLQSGLRGARMSLAGLVIGNIIYAFLLIFSSENLLEKTPVSLMIFKALGALYLLFLAIWQFFKPHFSFPFSINVNSNCMLGGLIVALSNPSFMIFYFRLVPQFINPNRPIMHQLFILSITQLIIDIMSLILYAFLANQIRAMLENSNKIMDKLVAACLVLSAFLLVGPISLS